MTIAKMTAENIVDKPKIMRCSATEDGRVCLLMCLTEVTIRLKSDLFCAKLAFMTIFSALLIMLPAMSCLSVDVPLKMYDDIPVAYAEST